MKITGRTQYIQETNQRGIHERWGLLELENLQ